MKLETAAIVSNIEAMPGVRLMELDAPQVALTAKAGQFVMVQCQAEMVLPRPFSLFRLAAAQGRVALLFAVRGGGTSWLAAKHAGELLQLNGPLGKGFSVDGEGREALLVAGGLGVAPLACLASGLEFGRVTMLIGAANSSLILPPRLLPEGVRVVVATVDGSDGAKGLVTDLIPDNLSARDHVYACGPLAMYRTMAGQRVSWPRAIPAEVSLEVRMGCGTGVCYGCTVKTADGLRQVCKDGPVFQLDDVRWESVVC